MAFFWCSISFRIQNMSFEPKSWTSNLYYVLPLEPCAVFIYYRFISQSSLDENAFSFMFKLRKVYLFKWNLGSWYYCETKKFILENTFCKKWCIEALGTNHILSPSKTDYENRVNSIFSQIDRKLRKTEKYFSQFCSWYNSTKISKHLNFNLIMNVTMYW